MESSPTTTDITADPILAAAAQVFAAKGFDGARVDEIAAAAGVNKAMLYYRVGDKAALYGAVLEQTIGATADRIAQATAAAASPADKVRAYVHEFAACALAQPHFAPMMMREVASGGANLPDGPLQQMGRIVNCLDQILRDGVAQGAFRAVNPFVAHMLVVGSVSFFNAGAPIRARIADSQGLDFRPDVHIAPAAMADQLADLLLGALNNN
jgi:AcrR family transcriptional regulator